MICLNIYIYNLHLNPMPDSHSQWWLFATGLFLLLLLLICSELAYSAYQPTLAVDVMWQIGRSIKKKNCTSFFFLLVLKSESNLSCDQSGLMRWWTGSGGSYMCLTNRQAAFLWVMIQWKLFRVDLWLVMWLQVYQWHNFNSLNVMVRSWFEGLCRG